MNASTPQKSDPNDKMPAWGTLLLVGVLAIALWVGIKRCNPPVIAPTSNAAFTPQAFTGELDQVIPCYHCKSTGNLRMDYSTGTFRYVPGHCERCQGRGRLTYRKYLENQSANQFVPDTGMSDGQKNAIRMQNFPTQYTQRERNRMIDGK